MWSVELGEVISSAIIITLLLLSLLLLVVVVVLVVVIVTLVPGGWSPSRIFSRNVVSRSLNILVVLS